MKVRPARLVAAVCLDRRSSRKHCSRITWTPEHVSLLLRCCGDAWVDTVECWWRRRVLGCEQSRCTCEFKSFMRRWCFLQFLLLLFNHVLRSHPINPCSLCGCAVSGVCASQCLSKYTIPTSKLASNQWVDGRADRLCLCSPLQQSLNYSLCVLRIGVSDCISGVQFIASHRRITATAEPPVGIPLLSKSVVAGWVVSSYRQQKNIMLSDHFILLSMKVVVDRVIEYNLFCSRLQWTTGSVSCGLGNSCRILVVRSVRFVVENMRTTTNNAHTFVSDFFRLLSIVICFVITLGKCGCRFWWRLQEWVEIAVVGWNDNINTNEYKNRVGRQSTRRDAEADS